VLFRSRIADPAEFITERGPRFVAPGPALGL
jgi:hypothetical protein